MKSIFIISMCIGFGLTALMAIIDLSNGYITSVDFIKYILWGFPVGIFIFLLNYQRFKDEEYKQDIKFQDFQRIEQEKLQ